MKPGREKTALGTCSSVTEVEGSVEEQREQRQGKKPLTPKMKREGVKRFWASLCGFQSSLELQYGRG